MLFPYPDLAIIDLLADEQHRGDVRPMPPRLIVLHTTEGTDSRSHLTTTKGSKVSAHRLIRTREPIYKLVPDERVAWTQGPSRLGSFGTRGYPNVNDIALSIEIEHHSLTAKSYPFDVIEKCAQQCLSWFSAYGLLPIVPHSMIQGNKHDPPNFPWDAFHKLLLVGLVEAVK